MKTIISISLDIQPFQDYLTVKNHLTHEIKDSTCRTQRISENTYKTKNNPKLKNRPLTSLHTKENEFVKMEPHSPVLLLSYSRSTYMPQVKRTLTDWACFSNFTKFDQF